MTRGSFCRSEPAAALRGLANAGLPASRIDSLSRSNASTGRNTSPRTSTQRGHRVVRRCRSAGAGSMSIVRTLGVTSSPVRPSPRVSAAHQPAVLVEQVDRQAVDLELAEQRRRPRRPSRRQPGPQAASSSKENALSRLIIRSRWSTAVNSVETAPPTFWVGESGVRSSGYCSSSSSQPAHPPVEVGVGQRRVVEHVVAPPGVLDLLGQARCSSRASAHGVWRGVVSGVSGRGMAHLARAATDTPGPPIADEPRREPTARTVTVPATRWTRTRRAVTGAARGPGADAARRHRPTGWSRSTAAAPRGGGRGWMMRQVAGARLAPGRRRACGCCATGSRGWNGGAGRPSPVPDARWALDRGTPRARRRARSCCSATRWAGARRSHVADDPTVVGVVALAPWLPPGEPVGALAGQAARAPPTAAATGSPRFHADRRPSAGRAERRRLDGGAPRHGPGRALHAPQDPGLERLRRQQVAGDDLPRRRPRPRGGPPAGGTVTALPGPRLRAAPLTYSHRWNETVSFHPLAQAGGSR